ncbi:MAG: hypothetical protein ACI8TX_001259 [Hyphomicrobiaceae bacterium]
MSLLLWILAIAAITAAVDRAAFAEVRSRGGRIFGVMTGIGLAVALTSATGFLAALWGDGMDTRTLFAESTALGVVASAALLALPSLRSDYYDLGHDSVPPDRATLVMLTSTATIVAILGLVQLWMYVAARPHGSPDGWAIWNTRARFLLLAPFDWTRSFRADRLGNPDYPLLVPMTVARIWAALPSATPLAPLATAFGFLVATLVLASTGIAWLAGIPAGIASFILLAGSERLIFETAAQAADVPLSFYYLCTCALLVASDRGVPRDKALILAGAAAAAAAWTKNEGMLFVVMCVATMGVATWRRHGRVEAIRDVMTFAAGSAPIALIALLFKTRYAPTTNLIADQSAGAFVSTLFDVSRHATVIATYATEIVSGFGLSLVALAAWMRLSSRVDNARPGVGTNAAIMTLVATFGGYYLVYVTTSADLRWHLDTSLNRLLLHFWPATVFVMMAGLRHRAKI